MINDPLTYSQFTAKAELSQAHMRYMWTAEAFDRIKGARIDQSWENKRRRE